MAFVFTFSISVCFVNSVKTRILIGQQGTERALTWRTRLLTNDTITLNMIKNDSEKKHMVSLGKCGALNGHS